MTGIDEHSHSNPLVLPKVDYRNAFNSVRPPEFQGINFQNHQGSWGSSPEVPFGELDVIWEVPCCLPAFFGGKSYGFTKTWGRSAPNCSLLAVHFDVSL